MSNVRDRGVIDDTIIEDNKYVLIINNDLKWNYATRQENVKIIQDKLNDYLTYITSGQAEETMPGLRVKIRIVSKYSYSKYCINFLESIKQYIKNKDDVCDIEWTHNEEEKNFDDGFSDDYVFEPDKIYYRLKKNWARNPSEEISLRVMSDDSQNLKEIVMFRFMDSFIGTILVDIGDMFIYFTYDMLPNNITPEQLQEIAMNNLSKNIQYRLCESKEKGIFGIIAGGDFESESICNLSIWEDVAKQLEDDIIISIPTKDIVFCTKLNDKKLRKKMIKMARKMFEKNEKNLPYDVFCKDVFLYSRESKQISISNEFSL